MNTHLKIGAALFWLLALLVIGFLIIQINQSARPPEQVTVQNIVIQVDHTLQDLAKIDTQPLLYLMQTCDYPGASQFYGLQEDDPIVDYLLTACED